MTNHLARVADLEFVGKDTIRKEADKAIDEAITIFEQVACLIRFYLEFVLNFIACTVLDMLARRHVEQ